MKDKYERLIEKLTSIQLVCVFSGVVFLGLHCIEEWICDTKFLFAIGISLWSICILIWVYEFIFAFFDHPIWSAVILLSLMLLLCWICYRIENPQKDTISPSRDSTHIENSLHDTTTSADQATYVASVNSDLVHDSRCSYADQILPKNVISFDSLSDAYSAGYNPCYRCIPNK